MLVMLAALVLALVAASIWAQRAIRVFRIEYRELTWTAPATETLALADLTGIEALHEVGWKLPDGARQRAFYLPPANGAVVVIVHGSPGSALGMLSEARGLARHGFGALLLDLPSYGGSEGSRTWGEGFRKAVVAALDFVSAQPGVRGIGAFGYSMSTALLTIVAADDPRIQALVVVAPYTRFDEQRRYQFRSRLPGMAAVSLLTARTLGLAADELDATDATRRLGDRPLLIIVGSEDGAIAPWMPRRLKDLAGNAELLIIPGAGHVNLHQAGEAYSRPLIDFYENNLLRDASPPAARGDAMQARTGTR
jgi:pimeloyl-ACP methyl ester carboxylesterase